MFRGVKRKVVIGMMILGALFSGAMPTVKIKKLPVKAINSEVQPYRYVLEDAGTIFKWKPTESQEEPIKMELTVGHTGWVAIGFREASKVNAIGMQQADMVVVWVQKDGTPVVCDFHTDTTDVPKLDSSQDYKLVSGEEYHGMTRVAFERKLVTPDEFDDVSLTRPVHLLWANSPHDLDTNCTQDFGSHVLADIGSYVERGVIMAMPLRESSDNNFLDTDLFSVMGYIALFLFVVVH